MLLYFFVLSSFLHFFLIMADEDEILGNEIINRNLQVEEFLAQGNKLAALLVSLSNPPVGTKSEELKVTIFPSKKLYN